jgi:hypothetical protein
MYRCAPRTEDWSVESHLIFILIMVLCICCLEYFIGKRRQSSNHKDDDFNQDGHEYDEVDYLYERSFRKFGLHNLLYAKVYNCDDIYGKHWSNYCKFGAKQK